MNYGIIRYILARILWLLSILMAIPFCLSILFKENLQTVLSLLLSIAISFIFSIALLIKPIKNKRMYAKEGFIICALAWIILSLIGSLPFYLSNYIPHFIDALFETASGFTCAGSTILNNIEALPKSLLFWRSLTHFIGGMGVLVFVLAIIPKNESSSVYVLKAEIPGPTFGKLVSKISDFSRIMYLIYLGLTLIFTVLLLYGKMSLFDALIHAMSTAGTGGFSNYNDSVAYFNSPYIEYVLAVGMIVFSINFNLYYYLILRQFKRFFFDEELKSYLLIIASATALLMANLYHQYNNLSLLLKDTFFTVSSIISTTGFSTVDFDKWPIFSKLIILILMLIGGCAGSTAGGLKVIRVVSLFKALKVNILQTLNPKRCISIKFNNKIVSSDTMTSIHNYFFIHIIIVICVTLILSLDTNNFAASISASISSINNIGPGFDILGPKANFSILNDISKISLIFSMIAGRLEILPVLMLFTPRTWHNH